MKRSSNPEPTLPSWIAAIISLCMHGHQHIADFLVVVPILMKLDAVRQNDGGEIIFRIDHQHAACHACMAGRSRGGQIAEAPERILRSSNPPSGGNLECTAAFFSKKQIDSRLAE